MSDVTLVKSAETQISESLKMPLSDAQQIIASFAPVATAISQYDQEFSLFVNIEEIDEEISKQAKKLRMRYTKARTQADKIHKAIKANVLLRSKAIDGARNIFKLQITEREEKLRVIEKHFEIIEQERKEKLRAERLTILAEIDVEEDSAFDLSEMSEIAWGKYLAGQKALYKIEQDRIAKEKEEQEAREKRRKMENNRRNHIYEKDLRKFVSDVDMDNIGLFDDKQFEALVVSASRKKKEFEDEQLKLRKQQEADRKEAEKQRKKAEKLEAEKRATEEKERKRLGAEEKAQMEAAKARKNAKYKKWLDQHGLTPEVQKRDDIKIVRVDTENGVTFQFWSKVDEITI